MKKGFLTILTALTVFALVMTGCPTDEGSSTPTTVITYDLNVPADADFTVSAVANKTINQDAELTDAQLPNIGAGLDIAEDGYVFVGWTTTADDATTIVTIGDKLGKVSAVTLFALWEKYDPVTISFVVGNGAWTADQAAGNDTTGPTATIHRALALGNNIIADPFKDKNTFSGWYTAATAGTKVTSATIVNSFAATGATAKLYAQYTAEAGLPTGVTAASKDIPIDGEWVVVANGIYPMYEFTLPTGKTWSDYDGIEAEIFVPANGWKVSNSVRGGRLMGNEKAANFKLLQYADGVKNQFNYTGSTNPGITKFAAIHMGSDSNPWILDNWASWTDVHGFVTGKLGYTYVDPNDEDGKPLDPVPVNAGKYVLGTSILDPTTSYIPVKTYKTDGSRKGGTYDMTKLPHAKATGPFYFGLGFSGNDPGTKQRIKNVVLKGKTGTSDVVAKAAYFQEGSNEYPAFIGYDGGASAGPANALYQLSDGGASTDGMYRGNDEPVFNTAEPPKAPATADLVVLATTDSPLVNTTEFSGGYNGTNGIAIEFTFPADLNISSYASIVISVKASTTDDEDDSFVEVTADSKVQFDFISDITDKTKIGGSQYNIKTADTTVTIPQTIIDVNTQVKGINVYNADASIKYIQVLKVTLKAPTP